MNKLRSKVIDQAIAYVTTMDFSNHETPFVLILKVVEMFEHELKNQGLCRVFLECNMPEDAQKELDKHLCEYTECSGYYRPYRLMEWDKEEKPSLYKWLRDEGVEIGEEVAFEV